MKISPIHCIPVREGTRVIHCARGSEFGGTKVKVLFLVKHPLDNTRSRYMSLALIGGPECRVGSLAP